MPNHSANHETGPLPQMSLPDRLVRAIGSLIATRQGYFVALLGSRLCDSDASRAGFGDFLPIRGIPRSPFDIR